MEIVEGRGGLSLKFLFSRVRYGASKAVEYRLWHARCLPHAHSLRLLWFGSCPVDRSMRDRVSRGCCAQGWPTWRSSCRHRGRRGHRRRRPARASPGSGPTSFRPRCCGRSSASCSRRGAPCSRKRQRQGRPAEWAAATERAGRGGAGAGLVLAGTAGGGDG